MAAAAPGLVAAQAAGRTVLIICVLVILGLMDFGRETHHWWPMIIAIAATPPFMWLYRRGFFS